jgi:hypothetical protein
VSTTGTPGELITFGFSIYNDERGPYFSSLNFTNPTEQLSSGTIFTGIPVGAADPFPRTIFHPEVGVSNFSTNPAEVTVTLAHTIAGKTSTEVVRKLVVAGQSSQTVQIPSHGDPAMTNSLLVRSSLPPGEVVSQFIAWGDFQVRTVELQAKDNDSVQNGGGHPWTIARGTYSTLLLFNHSLDGSKKFEVLVGNGKQLWVGSYQLASMETKAVKINEIVEKQIPDAKGTRLSKDIPTGQVGWWTHRAKWGKGRLMVSQPLTGMARSFSCGTCANLCEDASIYPDSSAAFPIGDTGDLGDVSLQECLATCGECGGTPQGPTTELLTWKSGNTSIATLYGGLHSTTATFQGVAKGTTTGDVSATDEGCTAQGSGPLTVCPTTTAVSSLTALSITLLFPNLKTGIGAVSSMQTGPATSVWDGTEITEAVTTVSNSCPATWGNICSGSSTFTVGEGGQATVLVNGVETEVGPVFPEQQNMFYDQHTLVSNASLLPTSTGQTSCTAVCTQTYSCGGQSAGSHTITYSFIEALINGTHVTSTEVSEQ